MTEPVEIDAAVLAAHPLPDHAEAESKHDRGTVLAVGGSAETPGALVLCGLAALRAGGGRLQLALVGDASALAVAVPESMALGLAADGDGRPDDDQPQLDRALEAADAVLVGPGALPPAAGPLLARATRVLATSAAPLVVDAAATAAWMEGSDDHDGLAARTVLIPNRAEACEALDAPADHPMAALLADLVDRTGCTVAVRGPDTWIGTPTGGPWVERSGAIGLGTSGSGDVFAGLITGFLARGADPATAAIWAAHVHARAGAIAAERHGPVNFLARELLDALAPAQVDAQAAPTAPE